MLMICNDVHNTNSNGSVCKLTLSFRYNCSSCSNVPVKINEIISQSVFFFPCSTPKRHLQLNNWVFTFCK